MEGSTCLADVVAGAFVGNPARLSRAVRHNEAAARPLTAGIYRPYRGTSLDERSKYTEFPGSERDLTLQGMAMIIRYGIVMPSVCLPACVVPTSRALKSNRRSRYERSDFA